MLTVPTMALLIRECSGIVCLCLTGELADRLDLPMMVDRNESRFQTHLQFQLTLAKESPLAFRRRIESRRYALLLLGKLVRKTSYVPVMSFH